MAMDKLDKILDAAGSDVDIWEEAIGKGDDQKVWGDFLKKHDLTYMSPEYFCAYWERRLTNILCEIIAVRRDQ